MKTICKHLAPALALCLLLAGCSTPQVNYHSSSTTSSAVPSASVAPPYQWVIQPSFGYDSMEPVQEDVYTGVAAGYLNVYKGNQWGLVTFENATSIFELEEDESNSKGMVISVTGHAFNFPPSVTETVYSNIEKFDIPLSGYGLPFFTNEVGEGEPDIVVLRLPSKELLFCSIGYDSLELLPEEDKQSLLLANSTFLFTDVPTDDLKALYFEYGLGSIGTDSRWGIITADGLVLHEANLPPSRYMPESDDIRPCFDDNGKVLYLSPQAGGPITQTAYDSTLWAHWRASIAADENTPYPGYFTEGLCPVIQNGKVGFINKQGDLVVPLQFEGATHVYQNKAWVKQNGQWGQIEFTL